MQKGTKKIFIWQNAFRLAAALERLPDEAESLVLAFGSFEKKVITNFRSRKASINKFLILAVRQLADLSEAEVRGGMSFCSQVFLGDFL